MQDGINSGLFYTNVLTLPNKSASDPSQSPNANTTNNLRNSLNSETTEERRVVAQPRNKQQKASGKDSAMAIPFKLKVRASKHPARQHR
jgi:hypothetical protein